MRKLTLSKIFLLVLVVLYPSNTIAAPAGHTIAAPELRITARDGDRMELVLARLKRFTRLIILSIDMIPPIP